MIKGSIVAIATPMKNDNIDEQSLRNLVDYQIEQGTDGVVPCGTTGQSATLTYDEHCRVIEIVLDQVAGRVPVIAGSGSNSTHESVYLTEKAQSLGADGALVITPYYNKPTQEGLYQHFKAVSESVDIPIILYNVPGRTSVNIEAETVIRLSELKNIKGIKEASGDMGQAAAIIEGTADDFSLLSGEDPLTFPLYCIGAQGVISASTNVAPKYMADMYDKFFAGDFKGAQSLHYTLLKIFKALFLETNPIPVHKALYLMGLIEDEVRLPLVRMTDAGTAQMKEILTANGVELKK